MFGMSGMYIMLPECATRATENLATRTTDLRRSTTFTTSATFTTITAFTTFTTSTTRTTIATITTIYADYDDCDTFTTTYDTFTSVYDAPCLLEDIVPPDRNPLPSPSPHGIHPRLRWTLPQQQPCTGRGSQRGRGGGKPSPPAPGMLPHPHGQRFGTRLLPSDHTTALLSRSGKGSHPLGAQG